MARSGRRRGGGKCAVLAGNAAVGKPAVESNGLSAACDAEIAGCSDTFASTTATESAGSSAKSSTTAATEPAEPFDEVAEGSWAWRAASAFLSALARHSAGVLEAVQAALPITQEDLNEAALGLAAEARPWSGQGIVFVRRLQDAARNKGHVDLMIKTSAEGKLKLAVKRMPIHWVCSGPAEFARQHPTSGERPWLDLGILRYLNGIGFPYVCQLRGIFRSEDETFIAMTFCELGDLFSWCDDETVPPCGKEREASMLPIVVQLFSAVRWLHNLGIAHRDLSLENVLLTGARNGRARVRSVRLCDFGMATLSRHVRREIRGKLPYQAPEMYLDADYDTFLADGFALGVVLFAMAAQDYPWECTRPSSCQFFDYVSAFGVRRFLEVRRLRGGGGERMINVLTPEFAELVEALLQVQPFRRATLGEAALASSVLRAPTLVRPRCSGASDCSGMSAVVSRVDVWNLAWLRGHPARFPA